MRPLLLAIVISVLSLTTAVAQNTAEDPRLTGTVIGTLWSVDYSTNGASTTVNTRDCAFDGNLNTYFASYERSYTWVGLDLGEPHVITRIGWAPASRSRGGERIVLGVFEGANMPDFMDALPLYIITQQGTVRRMEHTAVNCSKGFRYVRYVSPSDQRCNIGELEFYGHPGEGDDSSLYRLTNLPVVSIHTQDNVEPYDKKHDITALVSIIGDGEKQLRTDSAVVRLRGNASMEFPKKPYRIKYNSKHRVLDSPAKAKKWTLINNYGDKTLMRNLLAFELSRLLQLPYTPFARSVDVLFNGEYKGNYQLSDHVDVKEGRVELDDTPPAEATADPASTAFLIEADARATTEACWFYSAMGTPMTVHYPDDQDITPEQKAYIMDCFNAVEEDWHPTLDLSTFLRHFLVGEMSGNTDTYWSTYMYKHRANDTIFTGPVWDFDLAFDNDTRIYPVNRKHDWLYRSGGSTTGYMRSLADNVVVRDAGAKAELLRIWSQARRNGLTEDHLLSVVDQMESLLDASQQLNFMRWPIMGELVHQNPTIWGSYADEVQHVRRYISERIHWMDSKMGYTHEPSGIADAPVTMAGAYRVFTLSGMPCGSDVSSLPRGVYVVRQGNRTSKILTK